MASQARGPVTKVTKVTKTAKAKGSQRRRQDRPLITIINPNGASFGFEMCFAIGSQHLWCRGSQPKHVSNPA